MSHPIPFPPGAPLPRARVSVFAPTTRREVGNDRTVDRGRPLRLAWRAIVESLPLGIAPVMPAVEPLTASVGLEPAVMEAATVTKAVPVYARSRLKRTVQVPPLVWA